MSDNIIIQEIANGIPEFNLNVANTENNFDAFKHILAQKINELINTDFTMLVNILYRLDISEEKIKKQLQVGNSMAGEVIAGMIIQREVQKIETRALFKNIQDIPENEKW